MPQLNINIMLEIDLKGSKKQNSFYRHSDRLNTISAFKIPTVKFINY